MTVTRVMQAALALLLFVHPAAAEVWEGMYSCPDAQGVTGLTLTVEWGDDGSASALFNFYALPENPRLPEGCFTMRGQFSVGERSKGAGQHVRLSAETWLLHPEGYVTVDLTGWFHPRATWVGVFIEGPGCRGGKLDLVAQPAHTAPPACCSAIVS